MSIDRYESVIDWPCLELDANGEWVRYEDVAALEADARRYRWLRTAGAWESELGMDAMTPEQFDARVDAEIEAENRYTITPKGREMLGGKDGR